jgi:hypothetical protein
MHVCAFGQILDGLQMDDSHLWGLALRSNDPLQEEIVRSRSIGNDNSGHVWGNAKFRISGIICGHLSRSLPSHPFLETYLTFRTSAAINCFNHQAHEYLSTLPSSSPFKLPQGILDAILISKASFWLPGFMAGLALFVEEKKRRAELAMYVLPKALESAWIIGRNKVGILTGLRGGEGLVSTP